MSFRKVSFTALALAGLAVYGVRADDEVYGPPDPDGPALSDPRGAPDSFDEIRYGRPPGRGGLEAQPGGSPDSFDEIRRGRQNGDYYPDDQGDRPEPRRLEELNSTDMIGRPGSGDSSINDGRIIRRDLNSLDAEEPTQNDQEAAASTPDLNESAKEIDSDAANGVRESESRDDAAVEREPSSLDSTQPSYEEPAAPAEETTADEPTYSAPEEPEFVGDHSGG